MPSFTDTDGTIYNFSILSGTNVALTSITNNTATITIPNTFSSGGTTYSVTQIGVSGSALTIANTSILRTITFANLTTSANLTSIYSCFNNINIGSNNLSVSFPASITYQDNVNVLNGITCNTITITSAASAVTNSPGGGPLGGIFSILFSSTVNNVIVTSGSYIGTNFLREVTFGTLVFQDNVTVIDNNGLFVL